MSEADPGARVPTFRRGIKFRFDTVRDAWVVLAPERLFVPDEQAVEVLKLVDGARTLAAITEDLCARFAAPPDVVMQDVAAMLDDLAAKGVMTW
jgi:pyrroloquinoline quinone biosynthesis protein D